MSSHRRSHCQRDLRADHKLLSQTGQSRTSPAERCPRRLASHPHARCSSPGPAWPTADGPDLRESLPVKLEILAQKRWFSVSETFTARAPRSSESDSPGGSVPHGSLHLSRTAPTRSLNAQRGNLKLTSSLKLGSKRASSRKVQGSAEVASPGHLFRDWSFKWVGRGWGIDWETL